MANDFEARIERLMSTNNIPAWRYARRGKHRAVVVRHNGRDQTFIFPLSGSDRRGPRNLAAFMRRRLGLNAR
jgi:hypothetical protein